MARERSEKKQVLSKSNLLKKKSKLGNNKLLKLKRDQLALEFPCWKAAAQ